MRHFYTGLLAITLSLLSYTAIADRLGMDVVGDDDEEFGLLISNWVDDREARLFAPGFTEESLEPVNENSLQMQFRALEALGPRPQAQQR